MFSRLKGAIDSRIAEEQARQRQAALSASSPRSSSGQPRRRPDQNGVSLGRRGSRQREKQEPSTERGPDPAEFEPEFAVGDDESALPSRTGTPIPRVNKEDVPRDGEAAGGDPGETKPEETNGVAAPTPTPMELPTEVRVKLRKLDRLEGRYQELLKAYKTAHARVQLIEPFEASLRENTPLTSISDPGSLVEYLNQTNLKSDMVLDELKRVSSDRDQHKKQSEESERVITELRQEVSELKARVLTAEEVSEQDARPSLEVKTKDAGIIDAPDTSVSVKSPTPSASSRVPSFSIFSPKPKLKAMSPPKESSEEFFSYDSELPRLESELQERQAEVLDLKKQLESIKGDLAVARESTEGMVQSLETATRELHSLRDGKDGFEKTKDDMKVQIDELQAQINEGDILCKDLRQQVEQLQTEKRTVADALQITKENTDNLFNEGKAARQQLAEQIKVTNALNERLGQKDAINKDLEDNIAMFKLAERQDNEKKERDASSERSLAKMQTTMDALKEQLESANTSVAELKTDLAAKEEEFANRPSSRVFGFLDGEANSTLDNLNNREDVVRYLSRKLNLEATGTEQPHAVKDIPPVVAPSEPGVSGAGKKKNKKKKKGKAANAGAPEPVEHDVPVKVTEDLADADDAPASEASMSVTATQRLEQEITVLQADIETKNATIDRLSAQIKDQEALKEEIETLRDDLLHQGEEHVEARDALKEVQAQKRFLKESVGRLEGQLVEAEKKASRSAESEQAHKDLTGLFEDLKAKSIALQTDLSAAEQLATARFKDISDLRDLLSKAQPELRSLRSEVAELKSAKEDLKNKSGELNRLEARHDDLKAEMKGLGKRLGDKDAEIKELNQKIEQETSGRSRAEEGLRVAQSDLRFSEARKQAAVEEAGQLSKDLAKARADMEQLRAKMRDVDEQITSHSKQTADLREELGLKAASHTTSQNLVQSLRDQTHELSTQAREASTRADSLEEELAEAQKMLSERTRESQTMRMLLSQSETGVEGRLREMRERMDSAIEERDRIEDEAGVEKRRMVREVEEVRSRAREAQRVAKGMEDEKDDVERREREGRRRLIELEKATEGSTKELEEVKTAMKSLREALDEAELQVRELEGQRGSMRKEIEESKDRVEKLVKANKALSEEMKGVHLQHGPRKVGVRPGVESGVQSSRSSMDSSSVAVPRSPIPMARGATNRDTSSVRSETPTGSNAGGVDYVYLKNVLLQFLEQKDKSHQKQLVPVLGMLLHFDRKDEQKWMAAITAK